MFGRFGLKWFYYIMLSTARKFSQHWVSVVCIWKKKSILLHLSCTWHYVLIFHVHHNAVSYRQKHRQKKTFKKIPSPPCIRVKRQSNGNCLKMLSERCNTLVLQLGGRKRKTAFLKVWTSWQRWNTGLWHEATRPTKNKHWMRSLKWCQGAVQLVLHNVQMSFHFLLVPTNPRPIPWKVKGGDISEMGKIFACSIENAVDRRRATEK